MSIIKFPKRTLLVLLLISCIYIYFNDLLKFPISFNVNIDSPSNEDSQQVSDELAVSKNTELPEKTFTVQDVILLTAFSQNHFIEAL